VTHFECFVSLIENYARCTSDNKSRIAKAKAALNKKKTLFTSKLEFNLRKKNLTLHLEYTFVWSWNTNLNGHNTRRNCLLKQFIEGKIEGTRSRGRRREQLLDDLKERRRYWKLKWQAPDRLLWRTRFGSGYGPVVRQTAWLLLWNSSWVLN
jgi:hypothetical protein